MPFHEELSREAALCAALPGGGPRCLACAHGCAPAEGKAGLCGVRFNRGGKLRAPWGYVSGAAPDPIEKKPFFHVLPGARTLSFGMYGCNFHCGFCQNWQIAGVKEAAALRPEETSPEALAEAAVALGAKAVISTYNEPLITAEWGAAVFAAAKKRGLLTGFVSNGYATPEAAAFLRPHMDLWKVDLKSFDADNYRKVCGADLAKVLKGIETIKAYGFWVEAVTLLIPDFNDSNAEIGKMAAFLAGLSPDIPWHLTAFHPDHLMTDRGPTPESTLLRARNIALKKGLRYVYCGNISGVDGQNTVCPSCGREVVVREGFGVKTNLLGGKGLCPCGHKIPGVWS